MSNDLFSSGGDDLFTSDQGTDLFSSGTPDKASNVEAATLEKQLRHGLTKTRKEMERGIKSPADIAIEASLQRTAQAKAQSRAEGIDPNETGPEGVDYASNILKRVTSGFVTAFSDLGAAPSEYANFASQAHVPDEDVPVFRAIQESLAAGKPLTAEQQAYVNAPDEEIYDEHRDAKIVRPSSYKRMQNIESRQQVIDELDTFQANVRQQLSIDERGTDQALKKIAPKMKHALEAYDDNEYLASTGAIMSAMVDLATDDPAASVELAADSLPLMIMMVKSAALGIAGYSTGAYRQALQDFQEEHGREMNKGERAVAMGLSHASGTLDRAGATAVLGAKKLTSDAVKLTAKTGAKLPTKLLNSTIKATNVVTRPARAAASEGITEGTQSVLEQFAGAQDWSKVSAADALTEGVVGAVVGTGINIANLPADVKESAKALNQSVQGLKGKLTEGKVQKAAENATKTGDPTELINMVQDSDFINQPEETRLQNLQQITDALDATMANVGNIKGKEAQQAEIQKISDATNVLNALTATHNAAVDRDNGVDPKADLEQVIGADETVDVPTTIDRILGSKQVDTVLTESKLRTLFSSPSIKNAKPEQIKDLEERFINEQRKNSDQVSEEVMRGSSEGEFKGIHQYNVGIRAGIAAGNQEQVQKELTGLGEFAKAQRIKLNKLLQAWNDIHDEEGNLIEGHTAIVKGFTKQHPNWKVHGKSAPFIQQITTETQIAEADYAKLSEEASSVFGDIEAQPAVDPARLDDTLADAGIEPVQYDTLETVVAADRERTTAAAKEQTDAINEIAEEVPTTETAKPEAQTAQALESETEQDVEAAPKDRRKASKAVDTDQRENQRREENLYRTAIEELSFEERGNIIQILRDRNAAQTEELKAVQTALLVHELTGIGNRRAWEATKKKAIIGSIDADSLKYYNDVLGNQAGDMLLVAIAEELKTEFGEDAYHISGDEFWVHGDTEAEVKAGLDRVLASLKTREVEGEGGTAVGLGFSYGTDPQEGTADRKMKASKDARTKAGERVERGERPPGVTLNEVGQAKEKAAKASEEAKTAELRAEVEAEVIAKLKAAGVDTSVLDQAAEPKIEVVADEEIETPVAETTVEETLADIQEVMQAEEELDPNAEVIEEIAGEAEQLQGILNRAKSGNPRPGDAELFQEIKAKTEAREAPAPKAKAEESKAGVEATQERKPEAETTSKPKAKGPKRNVGVVIKELQALDPKGLDSVGQQTLSRTIEQLQILVTRVRKNPDYRPAKGVVERLRKSADLVLKQYKEQPTDSTKLPERLLQGNQADPKTGQSLSDYLKSSNKKLTGLVHQVPNILSNFLTDPTVKAKTETYTDEQNDALRRRLTFARKFARDLAGSNTIQKLMTKAPHRGGKDTKSDMQQDPLSYFIKVDENGVRSMDQNLLALMAFHAEDWLATQAAGTLYNKPETINAILGLPKATPVESNVQYALGKAGIVRNYMADQMGAQVYSQLGLTGKDAGIPGEFEANLKVAIGHAMINVLVDQGHLTQTSINLGNVLKDEDGDIVLGREHNLQLNQPTNFVRIAITEDNDTGGLFSDEQNQRMDDAKELRDPLNDFFGIENREVKPNLRPNPNVAKKLQGTDQDVSAEQLRTLKEMQKHEWKNNLEMQAISEFLGEEFMKENMGFVEDPDTTVHITKRDGTKAKNRSILKSIEHMRDWVAEVGDKTFHFDYAPWRMTRMGITSNTVNPQSDTMHRFHVGLAGQSITIDPNNKDQNQIFALAVSSAFGGKLDTTTALQDSITHMESLLDNDVITDAMVVINQITAGEDVDAGYAHETIQAAMNIGGEGFHTLAGLRALAKYTAGASFPTDLGIEVDGKTNGVVIGFMQSMVGRGMNDKLAAGHVFAPGYNAATTKDDNYQILARTWNDYIQKTVELFEMHQPDNAESALRTFSGIQSLVGPLVVEGAVQKAARDLTKKPLMITNYGAAVDRVVSDFSEAMLQEVYDRMVDASLQPDRTAQLQILEDQINQITGEEPSSIMATKTHEEILDFQMDKAGEKTLKSQIDQTYGDALRSAIEAEFSDFAEYRNAVNYSMSAVFDIFDHRYNNLVEDRQQALGRELTNKELKAVAKELIDSQPTLKTPLSDGVADSLVAINELQKTQYSDNRTIQQSFTRKLPFVNKAAAASVVGHSRKLEYRNAGVAALIAAVQSIDSTVNQAVLREIPALNVHDALIYSLADVVRGTQMANQAFYEINRDYHIAGEALSSLTRVMNTLTDRERRDIDMQRKFDNAPKLYKALEQAQNIVTQSAEARADFFAQPTVTNQYTFPGGEFRTEGAVVSEEDASAAIEEIFDNLKSSPDAQIDLDAFDNISGAPLSPDNTVNVFDSLSKVGTVTDPKAHTEYLREMLDQIVSGALAPLQELELKVHQDGSETVGMIKGNEVFIQAANQGIPNPVALSAQEVYAHELTHAITRHGLDQNWGVRQKVKQIWAEAKKSTTMEDFLPRDEAGNIVYGSDPVATRADAQARYDYIFENKAADGQKVTRRPLKDAVDTQNNFLHEFVAFGMTNQAFRAKLADVDATPVKNVREGSIFDRIQAAFDNLINWLSNTIHKTRGLKGDAALTTLVQELTDIHERKRGTLSKVLEIPQNLNTPALNTLRRFIFNPLLNFKARHKGSTNVGVRAANTIIGAPGALASEEGHQVIKTVTRNLGITEKQFLTQLAREIQGPTAKNMKFFDLMRFSKKFIDQNRKHLSDEVTEDTINSFQEPLNKMDSTAVNKAGLKTDLVTLFDQGINANEIMELLRNQNTLDTKIDAISNDIIAKYGQEGNYYVNQARGLGQWMATGVTNTDGLQLNATRIATLAGIPGSTPPKRLKPRIDAVDLLASLYAMDYTTVDMRSRMARLMETEYRADDGRNGITHTMNLHRNFKNDALEQLFHGNPILMVKGYTHETFNQAKSVRVATELNGKDLIQEGWVDAGPLAKDPKDPTSEVRHLYVSGDHQTMTWVKSTASLTNELVKGTTLADAYKAENSDSSNLDAVVAQQAVEAAEAAQVAVQFQNPRATAGDPTSKLIPISNDTGKTVGYRYTMSEHLKDTLLEKDNRFERVMGKMYGSVVDKVNSKVINAELVKLARDDYVTNYSKDPRGYVEVSNSSTDPEIREIYALLPKDMKQEIKREWGTDPMMVKADLVKLLFGFRKFSITDWKPSKVIESMMRNVGLGGKYVHLAKTLESYWQEGVGIAKDNIVIKNGVTLAGNIISNNALLYVNGVPPKDIVTSQATALSALNEFMGVVKEKNRIERLLKVTQNIPARERSELEAELARLKDDLSVNPIKPLIDEGIFQTISEDIDLVDDDIYSHKQKISNKLQAVGDKLPNSVISAYKFGYMTHDTAPYKLLLRTTQYSDFVARFALYEHLTKNEEMPHEQALARIIETFINYDIPTSRGMQYMNDIGAFMFTKFLFRIQRVILRQFKEKPAATLSVYALQEQFGEVSDILDSNLWTSSLVSRLNNPFEILDAATYAAGIDHATHTAGIDNPLE